MSNSLKVLLWSLFCLIFGYSFTILSFDTINPEIAYFWAMNLKVHTFSDVLAKYLSYDGGWYRPTVLYLYHWVISSISGWHNIKAFQIVTIILFFLNSYLVSKASRIIFASSFKECILIFIFVSTNLTIYINLYETNGFDFLYQIFSIIFMIICYRYFSREESFELEIINGALMIFAFVMALTSKEQAIMNFFLILVFFDYSKWKKFSLLKKKIVISTLLIVLLLTFIWLMEVALNFPVKTGAYRTSLDINVLIVNIGNLIQWMFRFNFAKTNNYIDIHNTFEFNIAPLMIWLVIVIALMKIKFNYKSFMKNSTDLKVIISVIVWSIFPLLFGGSPWHYALPISVFSIFIGRWFVLGLNNIKFATLRPFILASVLSTVIITSITSIVLERDIPRYFFSRIVSSVLSKVDRIQPNPDKVFFSSGTFEENLWAWSDGNIFNYAFLDPDLQVEFVGIDGTCIHRTNNNSLCFDLNIENTDLILYDQ